jgi:transcriptional regulator with XRE-family HTH domain
MIEEGAADLPQQLHYNEVLGARLKALRRARDVTQGEVCRATGISTGKLSGLEAGRGQNPTLDTLMKLAQYYQLGSLEELFGPLPTASWIAVHQTRSLRLSS